MKGFVVLTLLDTHIFTCKMFLCRFPVPFYAFEINLLLPTSINGMYDHLRHAEYERFRREIIGLDFNNLSMQQTLENLTLTGHLTKTNRLQLPLKLCRSEVTRPVVKIVLK